MVPIKSSTVLRSFAHCWKRLKTQKTHTLTPLRPWQRKEKKPEVAKEGKQKKKNTPEVACKLRWNADAANQTPGDAARWGGAFIQQ